MKYKLRIMKGIMNKIKLADVVGALAIFGFLILPFIPSFSQAAGIVPCDGTTANPCNFGSLIQIVQSVINFIIITAIPVAACLFGYAGFKYMTARGDTGEINSAHEIFMNVLWGFGIILGAWLIVITILKALGVSSSFSFLGSINTNGN